MRERERRRAGRCQTLAATAASAAADGTTTISMSNRQTSSTCGARSVPGPLEKPHRRSIASDAAYITNEQLRLRCGARQQFRFDPSSSQSNLFTGVLEVGRGPILRVRQAPLSANYADEQRIVFRHRDEE